MSLFQSNSRFPWRIFYRFVALQGVLILFALGISALGARYYFKKSYFSQYETSLKNIVSLLARDTPRGNASEWCRHFGQGSSIKLTVVAAGGTVLCDSMAEPARMGNHADRPEVQAALREGYGTSVRFNQELQEEVLFGALRLEDGRVLRASLVLSDLSSRMRFFDASFLAFLAVFAGLLIALSIWSGRQLAVPIGRILDKAHDVLGLSEAARGRGAQPQLSLYDEMEEGEDFYGELSDLETSLDHIRRDLRAKTESLSLEREELSTLMSAITDAILAVDAEGVPLFFNSRFAVLFGGEIPEKLRLLKLWEIFRAPDVLETFRAALTQGRAGSIKAIPFGESANKRFFSLSVSPLRKRNGDIYGALGIFHDVTELKSAEQIRIDFVANVSHELRTPLTSIKGYTDTLIEDAKNGRAMAPEFLDIIARNVSRLMNLIGDLLDLSSLESTDLLQKASTETDEISRRVIRQLAGNFSAKHQEIGVKVRVPTVLADSKRLEQVLVNLLDNASKYTPSGGKIEVVWEKEYPDRADILLKVVDNGPGIPPEHLPRLFERFYRVDKARSREQGGTGLGLAIVKHIMQKHEGAVWVETRQGGGTTFICRFPG